jgi:hypothetical protein
MQRSEIFKELKLMQDRGELWINAGKTSYSVDDLVLEGKCISFISNDLDEDIENTCGDE